MWVLYRFDLVFKEGGGVITKQSIKQKLASGKCRARTLTIDTLSEFLTQSLTKEVIYVFPCLPQMPHNSVSATDAPITV